MRPSAVRAGLVRPSAVRALQVVRRVMRRFLAPHAEILASRIEVPVPLFGLTPEERTEVAARLMHRRLAAHGGARPAWGAAEAAVFARAAETEDGGISAMRLELALQRCALCDVCECVYAYVCVSVRVAVCICVCVPVCLSLCCCSTSTCCHWCFRFLALLPWAGRHEF